MTTRKKKMQILSCCGANGRAVVFGTVAEKPVPGQPVELTDARMVLYWSTACGGLFGLAAKGPKEGTRITETVPLVVETCWQEWIEVTPEAAKALADWP
jgi:hypothetical protein